MKKSFSVIALVSIASFSVHAGDLDFKSAYKKVYGAESGSDMSNVTVEVTEEKVVSGRGPASVKTKKAKTTVKLDENDIAHMTLEEFQNNPYHLDDKVSALEIEKIFLSNKDQKVILNEKFLVLPVVENGVMQFEENGRLKLRKLKIVLAKK